jgi:sulfur-oxidizing protein SoxY
VASLGLGLALTPLHSLAQLAQTPTLDALVRLWAQGQVINTDAQGQRLQLDVPELVENGNAVPVAVRWLGPPPAAPGTGGPGRASAAGSAGSAGSGSAGAAVQEILLLNELNPQREVLRAQFGPACPRPELRTRIRLSASQRLVALARLQDGSLWLRSADVVVTLAACIE